MSNDHEEMNIQLFSTELRPQFVIVNKGAEQ